MAPALPEHTAHVVDAGTHPKVRAFCEKCLEQGVVESMKFSRLAEDGRLEHAGSIPGRTDAEELARMLSDALHSHAEGYGGQQRYLMQCWRRPDDPQFRWDGHFQLSEMITIDSGREHEITLTETRDQFEKGMLVSVLAHHQRMSALLIQATSTHNADRDRELQRLYGALKDRDEREDRLRKMNIDMQEQQKRTELDLLKAKREDRIHELGFNMLSLAGPAILAKALPSGGNAQAPLEGDLIKEFFEDLSPKQLRTFVTQAALDPAQLMALDALRVAYQKGEHPAVADPLIEKFLDTLTPQQGECFKAVLREDQLKVFAKIVAAYYERQMQRKAAEQVP